MALFALSGCKEIEGGGYPNACHISIAKRTKPVLLMLISWYKSHKYQEKPITFAENTQPTKFI